MKIPEYLVCTPCRGVSLGDLEEELFIAPLAIPKAPQRFYYKFGRPVQTSREDQNNPERVQQLYQEVQLKSPFWAANACVCCMADLHRQRA